ncbi:MAG: sugar nucleotide-binding protein, partial [Candidatus Sulfotelmatobacter sp.]
VDLARAIIQLCHRNASGIVHVTNAGDCTWYEFAREIVRGAGLATTVHPVSSEQMKRAAPRPAYSVLSSESLGRFNLALPPWRDALQRYLEERQS